MKSLTIIAAALSISAATGAAASVDPAANDPTRFVADAPTDLSSNPMVVAQARYRYRGRYWYRYRGNCFEDLGYGRTGTYGCSG
jgi:hypothetical protein